MSSSTIIPVAVGYVRFSPRHDWQKDTSTHVGPNGASDIELAVARSQRIVDAFTKQLHGRGTYPHAEAVVRVIQTKSYSDIPSTVKRGQPLPGTEA